MSDLNIILPSKLSIVSEVGTKGVYEIDGLYPGYGHTLGNSLRRIILSSLTGAAITSLKIDGVDHEFSVIDGVKEDVITILLHLKQVRFRLNTDEPQTVRLNVKGPKQVTAADIEVTGQVEVLNNDLYIAEVTGKVNLDIEMKVEKGLGFIPKEVIQKEKVEIPKNWHQLDKTTDGYYGISLDKAYNFIKTKKLKSKTVLVAIVDSGIDTLHEDLKSVLWVNPKEIPGNKKDDDKNGHIDDVHGWNFIGGTDGRNVKEDSYEAARVYNKLKAKYSTFAADTILSNPIEKSEFETYKKAQQKVAGSSNPEEVAYYKMILPPFLKGDSVIRKELGKQEYNCNDLEKYSTDNADAKKIKGMILQLCQVNKSNELSNTQLIDELNGELRKADAAENAPK